MSGHLSLITGLLLKDCLEDQRNLLVPDGGGHILAVTHTAAVQWFRLMMSVAPSSLEAAVTNGRTLRAVLALWDLWSWGESCSLEGAAAALEPKVAAGSKFKGRGGLQWRRLDLPAAWLDRLSHKDWMKTTLCVCTNIYLSLFCRTVLDV